MAENTKQNAEKITYNWGKTGPNYWQTKNGTVMQAFLRKSDKGMYELCIRIQNLDEDGKFIKKEDGTFDNGLFNFSAMEVAKVSYQLEQMFPSSGFDNGTIGGIVVNHISPKTNNGAQFEIVNEEEGTFIYITYAQNGEAIAQYAHLLSNDQKIEFFNGNGEDCTEMINMDIISFKALFTASYPLVCGIIDSVFECNNMNINNKSEAKTGGKITGGIKRNVRPTLGSKRVENISEDEEDEAPVTKRTTGIRKASSNLAKSSNMKALLSEDDDDEIPFD